MPCRAATDGDGTDGACRVMPRPGRGVMPCRAVPGTVTGRGVRGVSCRAATGAGRVTGRRRIAAGRGPWQNGGGAQGPRPTNHPPPATERAAPVRVLKPSSQNHPPERFSERVPLSTLPSNHPRKQLLDRVPLPPPYLFGSPALGPPFGSLRVWVPFWGIVLWVPCMGWGPSLGSPLPCHGNGGGGLCPQVDADIVLGCTPAQCSSTLINWPPAGQGADTRGMSQSIIGGANLKPRLTLVNKALL